MTHVRSGFVSGTLFRANRIFAVLIQAFAATFDGTFMSAYVRCRFMSGAFLGADWILTIFV